jgi:hypothetical protein
MVASESSYVITCISDKRNCQLFLFLTPLSTLLDVPFSPFPLDAFQPLATSLTTCLIFVQ